MLRLNRVRTESNCPTCKAVATFYVPRDESSPDVCKVEEASDDALKIINIRPWANCKCGALLYVDTARKLVDLKSEIIQLLSSSTKLEVYDILGDLPKPFGHIKLTGYELNTHLEDMSKSGSIMKLSTGLFAPLRQSSSRTLTDD